MKKTKKIKIGKKKVSLGAAVVIVILYLIQYLIPLENEKVILVRCIDGDTARFKINGVEETVRFLAIDTPEINSNPKKSEPFGNEAAHYTCSYLEKADEIKLEFEEGSERDKYERLLAWVFVDDTLLQKELISKGLAEVKYVYGDYKYVPELKIAQEIAKTKEVGMWK